MYIACFFLLLFFFFNLDAFDECLYLPKISRTHTQGGNRKKGFNSAHAFYSGLIWGRFEGPLGPSGDADIACPNLLFNYFLFCLQAMDDSFIVHDLYNGHLAC